MTVFVLVHGGSVTGEIWKDITNFLQADKNTVFSPTLLDEYKSNLTMHITQVCTLIRQQNLDNIILVGHSYGGMIITGVAGILPDRISRLIYIDAAIPKPGESLFDIIRQSGKDPLSFDGLEALPPYIEKLQFDPIRIASISKMYIICTQSEFSCIHNLVKNRIKSSNTNWRYFELKTTHTPMRTMPKELAQILINAKLDY